MLRNDVMNYNELQNLGNVDTWKYNFYLKLLNSIKNINSDIHKLVGY